MTKVNDSWVKSSSSEHQFDDRGQDVLVLITPRRLKQRLQRNQAKPTNALLNEHIWAYAEDRPPNPYSDLRSAEVFWHSPRDRGLEHALHETRKSREEFVQINADLRQLLKLPHIAKEVDRSFVDYYQAFAQYCVEGFARRAGVLPACQSRGLSGLLNVKVVRVTTLAMLITG